MHSDSHPSPADPIVERRARRFWVSFIVALLGLQIVLGGISIYLAVGDPSVAIVPNYHQAALNWDSTRRAHQLFDRLGWDMRCRVEPVVVSGGEQRRAISIMIRDQHGKPISELNLNGLVFHHARGSEIFGLAWQEAAPGIYTSDTALVQSGLWQLDLQIEGEHGVARQRLELTVE